MLFFKGGNSMKKFLSLVLALVMTMSLVTVSAGAKEFADDDSITYEEAVNVISEIGVVDGYTDGNFKPTAGLTRGAAAKIICNLILGPTTAAELRADTAPFKDVSVNHDFAGYIAYCAKEGIISGYGDGAFRPAAPLTGYAFMKMLLGALGYDSTREGYTGANWSINVAKRAINAGLNKGLVGEFDGAKNVNREEAALYAFNTLQADMVEYGGKVLVGDVAVVSGDCKALTWQNSATRKTNIKDDDYVQFAEQYFPKLEKTPDTDDFMRPSHTWLYKKTELGTYVDTDKLVESYTTEVTGKTVYDLLKASVIKENDLEAYVDGAVNDYGKDPNKGIDKDDLVRSNNNALNGTGNGVLTEIYLDTDKDVLTIVSINTYLAQATADYNEKKEFAPLNVFLKDASGTNRNVDVEDVPEVEDVKDEEYYCVNVSYKNSDLGEVVVISEVEIMEDSTVTKFSAGSAGDGTGTVSKVTTGGTQYKRNAKAYYDDDVLDEYNADLLTDCTYTIYLDQYGYFIGIELFEGSKNYVFITGYDLNGSNIAVAAADAAAIFPDGTMKAIKVNVKATNDNIEDATGDQAAYFDEWESDKGTDGYSIENNWYTYTVDKNGEYTLKPCVRSTKTTYKVADYADKDAPVIKTDSLVLDDDETAKCRVYGEDATVFLTVGKGDVTKTTDEGITEVTGVYTGVQNVDLEIEVEEDDLLFNKAKEQQPQVYTVYDSDNYVIAAIVMGEATGATGNYAYILGKTSSEELKDDTYYWEFDAIIDGEVKTLTAKGWDKTIKNKINSHVNDVLELRFDGDIVVGVKDDVDLYTENEFEKQRIDGEDVYFVNAGKVDDQVTLNLQGRTLYVTGEDFGLALSSDCKAVTIQKENNKANVKTQFNSVKSAIAHLADGSDAEGTQFYGHIVAALDSRGVAQWVVFVNGNTLSTGKDPVYNNKGLDLISLQAPDNTSEPIVTVEDLSKPVVADVATNYTATVKVTTVDGVQVYKASGLEVTDGDVDNQYAISLTGYLGTATVGNYVVSVTLVPNDGVTTGELSAQATLAIL